MTEEADEAVVIVDGVVDEADEVDSEVVTVGVEGVVEVDSAVVTVVDEVDLVLEEVDEEVPLVEVVSFKSIVTIVSHH